VAHPGDRVFVAFLVNTGFILGKSVKYCSHQTMSTKMA